MRSSIRLALFSAGLLLATAPLTWSRAETSSQSTHSTQSIKGICKDGTSFAAPTTQGACSGHGGIKSYTGAAATSTATGTGSGASSSSSAAIAQKPGGGKGKVWVNTETKIFHCPGSRYYGKTSKGEYMSEQAAIGRGYHKAKNDTCS